ncbi:molybdopterin-guanine dinucleotide biosynthesis protein B [Limosilactobacillus reuteri]|uniref:molybdopterin-guanine dinucleotide biosynthesis protein B n=1 Tax=Limosilactobacillus reuteri TaxID=1598 RepID=UPI001E2C3DBA|nr:molybdopterin-guanine dinucleotide biosynthesis protein B [Limosilactobacillus reuteri]MCC4435169.1 molybdopterin-guanine dinucleotide biosynthesis protein B [Limosilactobacillus reuteri]MCC4437236.1 molybdopterin-guanine dinucleotide biosynthesis protein B [Limosilactobacillus reuteri]MCC4441240.1 molybdopterin-guanine dinucleotide biosynthesis protein B [Limosilactobacillus reuteri]MCC4443212.1 molybdopterin-guanine dinucleotide biosynthesis protein B [Limosilactobacillus reuteri]MCC44451
MAITLQIIGHKKSGKTLITTTLIERLTKEGYRVAALKHDVHNATMDVPNTDSARMSNAGAKQVILQSATEFFFHQNSNVPPLTEMVEMLSIANDFVLIEGHKEATQYPQLLLLKPGEDPTNIVPTPPLKTGSIFNGTTADLLGKDAIVSWCYNYLKQIKGDAG